MGLFDRFRRTPKQGEVTTQKVIEDKVAFTPTSAPNELMPKGKFELVDQAENIGGIGYSDLNEFSRLAERRDQRYTVYDEMRQNDSLASAVLEMYADDITLPDPQGNSIWVESENANIAEAGNRLLRILKIEDNIWEFAYGLVCYGDLYLELFRDKNARNRLNEAKKDGTVEEAVNIHKEPKSYDLQDYVEKIDDPSEIFDLITKGRTVGFIRTHVNSDKMDNDGWNALFNANSFTYRMNRNDIDVYDSKKFVHIFVPDAGVRHPYKFVINLKDEVKDGDRVIQEGKAVEFDISTGKSLLQDAYKTSQQLQLAENSILLSRLTRASIYRLIQVNVGQKNEVQTLSIVNRLKSLFDKKQVADTKAATFNSYANPGPVVSNLIIPVKGDGQGTLTTSTIGGDYDPKSLADLDYLINKELATFKVPRQYLNFTDGGGFNGGSSLAKISAQYAHRIVRFKKALITGFERLLNIYFSVRYPDYVGKFEVKMAAITTTEDAERVETARSKLDMVGQIMDELDKMEDEVGKFKILKDAFEDAYPNSTVSTVLDDYIKKLEASQDSSKVPESNEGEGGDGGRAPFIPGTNLGSDSFSSPSEEGGEGEEPSEETSNASEFPTDLSGDIDYTDTDAIDQILNQGEEV